MPSALRGKIPLPIHAGLPRLALKASCGSLLNDTAPET